MRMLCMLSANGCRHGLNNNRKFNDETRAHGMVFFYADRAMMIFNNAAHDCQAKSSAAFLGGEIWQEEFLLEFSGHAMTSVGDGDFHRIASGDPRGRSFNAPQRRTLRR